MNEQKNAIDFFHVDKLKLHESNIGLENFLLNGNQNKKNGKRDALAKYPFCLI